MWKALTLGLPVTQQLGIRGQSILSEPKTRKAQRELDKNNKGKGKDLSTCG